MTKARGVQVVWLKRDLRIHDNRALAMAAQRGPVIALFVAAAVRRRKNEAY